MIMSYFRSTLGLTAAGVVHPAPLEITHSPRSAIVARAAASKCPKAFGDA